MKERPVIFSAPMVRAILEGRKTMTRRVVKPYRMHQIVNLAEAEPTLGYSGRHNDPESWGYEFLDDGAPASLSTWPELCPYGQQGDRLWVRETFAQWPSWELVHGGWSGLTAYRAGKPVLVPPPEKGVPIDQWPREWRDDTKPESVHWHPSIHMPRRASRITLEVTGVRVERLQDITEADAIAEGLLRDKDGWRGAPNLPWFASPVAAYRSLWESINGAGSWDANPWVWVVEFKRVGA